MSWATVEAAVISAVQHASGVTQVRLSTEERQQDRRQRVELSFELELVPQPEDLQSDVEGGLDLGQIPEVRIIARMDVISYTHAPDASAYSIAYRLVRRSDLQATRDILDGAGLVLERVERAVPINVQADQRTLSAMTMAWILRIRSDEIEGSTPDGEAPRDYFDKIELTDDGAASPPVALAEDLAPAALLDVADWRTLWLGSAVDLVRGRALVDVVAGALHDQAATIGSGVLDCATVFPASGLASLQADDPDAGVLAEDLAVFLLVRAGAGAGLVASRSSTGAAGWELAAAADGALELAVPAAGIVLTTEPGLLDGETWLLAGISLASGQVRLHVHGEAALTGACTFVQSYEDAPLVLGARGADVGLSGLELALLGEARTDDVPGLLTDLDAALGL